MISEDVIQKIKDENDIVDVISESVKLKKSGRYYVGLCPFHHEKTPSFTVTPDKQIFKCFGCGAAGNVFSFVMKLRNISYIEAVKALAERVNIDIETDNKTYNSQKNTIKRYYEINKEAARFFFSNLRHNKKAYEYLKNRNISISTIKSFGLGYANDSWNDCMDYLKKKGYSELDLLSCGLIIKSDKGRFYDRFRNRIMFPIFDYMGKVIGFGGRVLDDSKPKYLNSPETILFKKGTNLYGLNFVLKKCKDYKRELIIVEGYMDCISLHQAGIYNVVASLGTALTPTMAKLIKRYADRVVLSYDADNAGMNAADRGLMILKKEGLEVRILSVPDGKDPDEFIRKNSKKDFLYIVHNSLSLIDYRIKRVKVSCDLSDASGITKYIQGAIKIIKDLDSVERDIYVNKLSSETGIKETAIYDLMKGEFQNSVHNGNKMNSAEDFGQNLYLEPVYIKYERILLKIICSNPEAYDYCLNLIDTDTFESEAHKKIFNLIKESISLEGSERMHYIEIRCDDIESSKEWANIMSTDLIYNNDEYKTFIDDCLRNIKITKLEEKKKQVMNYMKKLENKGKIDESFELMAKLEKIQKEIGGMKSDERRK